MAVAYFNQWPTPGGQDPAATAARVSERVDAKLGGRPPAGGVFHAEGPDGEGGWWGFDVWASEDDREAFERDILDPALAAAGAAAGTRRRLEVSWDSTQTGGTAAAG